MDIVCLLTPLLFGFLTVIGAYAHMFIYGGAVDCHGPGAEDPPLPVDQPTRTDEEDLLEVRVNCTIPLLPPSHHPNGAGVVGWPALIALLATLILRTALDPCGRMQLHTSRFLTQHTGRPITVLFVVAKLLSLALLVEGMALMNAVLGGDWASGGWVFMVWPWRLVTESGPFGLRTEGVLAPEVSIPHPLDLLAHD